MSAQNITPTPSPSISSFDFRLEEVSPRDGLQRLTTCPPAQIVKFIELIYQAGLRHIEVGSLVNPKIVPAMASTMEVMKLLFAKSFADLQISVLVPRVDAFLKAAAAGVSKVAVAISRDEKFQEENWHNTIQEGKAQIEQIFDLREQKFPPVKIKAYLMMAFNKARPLEEDISLVKFLGEVADEVCLADTAAAATRKDFSPEDFQVTLKAAAAVIPLNRLGLHLHGKSEEVLALGEQAAKLGIRNFDTALGGVGGCPFINLPVANADTRLFNKMLQKFGPHQGEEIKDDALLAAEKFLQTMIKGK